MAADSRATRATETWQRRRVKEEQGIGSSCHSARDKGRASNTYYKRACPACHYFLGSLKSGQTEKRQRISPGFPTLRGADRYFSIPLMPTVNKSWLQDPATPGHLRCFCAILTSPSNKCVTYMLKYGAVGDGHTQHWRKSLLENN